MRTFAALVYGDTRKDRFRNLLLLVELFNYFARLFMFQMFVQRLSCFSFSVPVYTLIAMVREIPKEGDFM